MNMPTADGAMDRAFNHRCVMCNVEIKEGNKAFCCEEHRQYWKKHFWYTAYVVDPKVMLKEGV